MRSARGTAPVATASRRAAAANSVSGPDSEPRCEEDRPRATAWLLSRKRRRAMRSSYPDDAMKGRCALVAGLIGLVGCGGGDERPPVEPAHRTPPAAEISELEIRGGGANVDRFAFCPPPGELGQQWFPPPTPWTPPPSSGDAGPTYVDQDFIARTAGRSPSELAAEATH